jgi:hypothetical protein
LTIHRSKGNAGGRKAQSFRKFRVCPIIESDRQGLRIQNDSDFIEKNGDVDRRYVGSQEGDIKEDRREEWV